MGYDSKGIFVLNLKYEHAISFINNFFILLLNTTLFYNFMLPVNRYLAMNTFCRSMTYYQISTWMTSFSSVHICIAFRLLRRGNMKLHTLLSHPVSENFVSWWWNVHIFESLSNCEIVEMIDRFPVYIKTMQSCSSMFDTSSQSFQRQDD
jgi:hypothetical protein